jgi:hypothetical protein
MLVMVLPARRHALQAQLLEVHAIRLVRRVRLLDTPRVLETFFSAFLQAVLLAGIPLLDKPQGHLLMLLILLQFRLFCLLLHRLLFYS